MLESLEVTKQPESTCKGVFFKVEENAYYQNDVFFRSIKLKKLKRKSCPGCEECAGGWFEEFMEMDTTIDFAANIDTGNIFHGDIVEPMYTPVIDRETGVDEGGDIQFRKVKEIKQDEKI